MLYNEIPPQKVLFYDSKWTKEMDTTFLTSIIEMKQESYRSVALKSAHALLIALGVVNAKFGCSLRWEDVQERIAFLEGCYQTFKKIIQLPGTHSNLQMNYIIFDERVWKGIFKENKFAQAYYHQGKPEFDKLATIFGRDNVKVEHEDTIIIISDSTILAGKSENVLLVDSSDEEMTSSMPKL